MWVALIDTPSNSRASSAASLKEGDLAA
jgi:hypothetical protein